MKGKEVRWNAWKKEHFKVCFTTKIRIWFPGFSVLLLVPIPWASAEKVTRILLWLERTKYMYELLAAKNVILHQQREGGMPGSSRQRERCLDTTDRGSDAWIQQTEGVRPGYSRQRERCLDTASSKSARDHLILVFVCCETIHLSLLLFFNAISPGTLSIVSTISSRWESVGWARRAWGSVSSDPSCHLSTVHSLINLLFLVT